MPPLFVKQYSENMARGTHALGGKFRGRIGDKTLYVRNGQQIVYERTGGRRTPVDTRHQLPNLALILAQRWKTQLADDGVAVGLSVLLDWAYSILNAPRDGSRALVSSGGGAWAWSGVSVEDSNVACLLRARNAAQGGDLRQPWGGAFRGYGGFETAYVIDRVLNIYPSGSRFVSIVGENFDSARLVIGRRKNFMGGGYQSADVGSGARWWGVSSGGQYIWHQREQLDLADVAYRIVGWAPPQLVVSDGLILGYAIIRADGVPIEMHTRFVTA